jgi:hypothetical protein
MRASSKLLPLVSLATLAAAASPALAGSYVSLGLGGEPALQGDLETAAGGDEGGNGRLALGQRFGRLAIEASVSRFAVPADDATAAGIHARLAFPLGGHFEAYGRLGLERLWLGDSPMTTVSGDASGLVGGGGLEYRLTAPLLGSASIWAELSQDKFTTESGAEGGVRLWTLGASIGL